MSKSQSILVIGSTGQIGQSIQSISIDYPYYEFVFANRQHLDLSNEISITNFFEGKNFEIIINCAAHTSVDKAESEPELANQVNHLAVKQLAGIAKQKQAPEPRPSQRRVRSCNSEQPINSSLNKIFYPSQ